MQSIVIYATRFGNTEKIARAIAHGLRTSGSVQLYAADEAPMRLPPETDFLLIGGPTEAHSLTSPMAQYFSRLDSYALHAVAAAAFDTRMRWPRWLSGSAAEAIAQHLRTQGAQVIAPPESFFVKNQPGTPGQRNIVLEDGEIDRAHAWAIACIAMLADLPRLRTLAKL